MLEFVAFSVWLKKRSEQKCSYFIGGTCLSEMLIKITLALFEDLLLK